jgi:hypothetical protein
MGPSEQLEAHDWSNSGFRAWLAVVWLAGHLFGLLFGLLMF